jgi:hypothetical protein
MCQGVQELHKKGPLFQPGRCLTIGKHHPTLHAVFTRLGGISFWIKVTISKLSQFLQQCKGLGHEVS